MVFCDIPTEILESSKRKENKIILTVIHKSLVFNINVISLGIFYTR